MAPVTQNSSSIAMALAGMAASVDIPKPHDGSFWTGRDSFAAVAARSLPTKKQSGMLPTPPNSISPSLPPQAFNDKGRTSVVPPTPPAGPTHVDSDIDLQDAVDHAKAQDQPQRGLSLSHHAGNLAGLDTAGAITPGLLAKHHLPSILLTHGPLAIRHIMGHLTTSVPGFSGIPPAKARRLVVGALEGRGSGSEASSLPSDVFFEKVGWGRWDAKQRGPGRRRSRSRAGLSSSQPTRQQQASPAGSTPPSSSARLGLGIPTGSSTRARTRGRHSSPASSRASDMELSRLSRSEEAENEADNMSLDGADESCSLSSSSEGAGADEDLAVGDEVGDVTDEEDWASIGAKALRLGSLSRWERELEMGRRGNGIVSGGGREWVGGGGGGGPAREALALALPLPVPLQQGLGLGLGVGGGWSGLGELMGGEGEQEREAVEALVRLSEV